MNDDTYIKLAKHCIGLDHKTPYRRHGKLFYRPYRNYFTTPDTESSNAPWEMMMFAGYADGRKSDSKWGGWTYWLTRSGLDWIGDKLGITIYDEED